MTRPDDPTTPTAHDLLMRKEMARRDRVSRLMEALERVSDQEFEVVALVAEGVLSGEAKYGRLDVATDARDFRDELIEELRDGLVYAHAEILRERGLRQGIANTMIVGRPHG
jgi:hypothetical protein